MGRVKRFIGCLLSISIILVILTGCTFDDTFTLMNAIEKSMKIRSMESKSDFKFNMQLSGLSEENQEFVNRFLPMLNHLKIQTHQKVVQNQNRTKTNSQIDTRLHLEDRVFNSTLWVDSDYTCDKPILNQTIKLPEIVSENLPGELAGKQYMSLNPEEVTGESVGNVDDYRRMMNLLNDFQPKLIHFLKEYAQEFDPGLAVITSKGEKIVNGEQVKVYELRLSDKSLKALVKYTLTHFAQNEKAKNALKTLLLSIAELSGETGAGQELKDAFDELRDGSSTFSQDINQLMNAFKDVKLLGERGIAVDFSINDQGYIVNQNGIIDIIIDTKAMVRAMERLEEHDNAAGFNGLENQDIIIHLGLEFNTDIYNINKEVKIVYPQLNEQNSFNFMELAGLYMGPMPDVDNGGLSGEPVHIVINDTMLDEDISPIKVDEIVLVPIQEISEKLGAKVNVNGDTVRVVKGGIKIEYVENSMAAMVNDEFRTLEFPVIMDEDRLYAPVGFVAESFGASVEIDEVNNLVIITTN